MFWNEKLNLLGSIHTLTNLGHRGYISFFFIVDWLDMFFSWFVNCLSTISFVNYMSYGNLFFEIRRFWWGGFWKVLSSTSSGFSL